MDTPLYVFFLTTLAASGLHNANNDDGAGRTVTLSVQHVAVVCVTDGEVAQTAGTDDAGHCGQVQQADRRDGCAATARWRQRFPSGKRGK